jgi:hypothetical protein
VRICGVGASERSGRDAKSLWDKMWVGSTATLLRGSALLYLRLVAGLTRLVGLVATSLPTPNAAEAKAASQAEGSAAGKGGGGGFIGCIVTCGACGGRSSG